MFRPLELFIALRYARSRAAGNFVSFNTWLSVFGVALGVWALIVILSVMNGFEGDLRERLLSLAAHATLSRADGSPLDGAGLAARARALPGVIGAAPTLEQQALVSHGEAMSSVLVRGVDPALEPSVSGIEHSLVAGALTDLKPGANRVLLGRGLAFQLGISVGDEVTVMVPTGDVDGGLTPRVRAFTVAGLFEVGVTEQDTGLVLVDIGDLAALLEVAGPSGLRLTFSDVFAAPARAAAAAAALGPGLVARDWTVDNSGVFRAIRIEKTMMTLILTLAVGVAAFNIVATLVMVVRAKRTDIAILRTLGLAPRGVVAVFVGQGAVIGWLGTALGAATGLLTSLHVAAIAAFLQRLFRFEFFDSNVYYVTRIPSQVEAGDVAIVIGTALAVTLLATVYPAVRAARTEPADALRYE
jgi:lipoprotein-releasing system permease protein